MGVTMKAKRATIAIGTIEIDVFQLPDSSYRMSQTQVAETVGKKELSFRQFFQSKWLKALPGIEPDSVNFIKIEREDEAGAAISGVPLLFASAYWLKEAIAKNKQAQILAWACMAETLTRRCCLVGSHAPQNRKRTAQRTTQTLSVTLLNVRSLTYRLSNGTFAV